MTQARAVIQLYARPGCHLCESALESLRALQNESSFDLSVVNIDESHTHTEKYGLMIPVAVLDGVEVSYGQIDISIIRKRLQEKNSAF